VVDLDRHLSVVKGLAYSFLLAKDRRIKCAREMQDRLVSHLVLLAYADDVLCASLEEDASNEL